MRRRAVVLVVLGTAVGLSLTVAQAQSPVPVPTVNVTASPTSIALSTAGPLAAGPTRFAVGRGGGKSDLGVFVGLLVPGVSVERFTQTLTSNTETALGMVSFQGSTAIGADASSRAFTMTLQPGLTYVAVAGATGGRKPRYAVTTFSTAADANGATAPAPDAAVQMVGLRFRGDRVLPRNGVVRFTNRSASAHIAVAFGLRKGVTSAEVGRALRSSQESLGRIFTSGVYQPQEYLSGGGATDDVEVRFPKAGRYALVCFVDEHHRLGMYRVVSVK